ncbi:MAG: hypothetical protein ACWA41_12765 [Putridiphycobacter sp.]
MTFTNVENGDLRNRLAKRSRMGWKLIKIERYFSKQHQEDCLFWTLERDVPKYG